MSAPRLPGTNGLAVSKSAMESSTPCSRRDAPPRPRTCGKSLRDITSGNNDTDGLLDGQFAAGTGWDACTDWGAPDGAKLLNALKP
jgi:hypothetical protein